MIGELVRTAGLALAVAAGAAEPTAPCTPASPGAWVQMSVEGAPEIGDFADVKTAFLGRGKWWLWNAYRPLTESRVFDARCNAWRHTTMAKGLPAWLGRAHGVMAPGPGSGPAGELLVYGPTQEPEQGSPGAQPLELAVFALDPETLQWTNVAPEPPPFRSSPQMMAGEGRLVLWDLVGKTGAVLALASRRWEPFTEPPPLAGHGYDCSFLHQGAWLIANPNGVFRFDLATRTWTAAYRPTAPMPMPDLGACNVSFSGGLAVAVAKALYGGGRTVYAIEGAAVRQIPWPDGGENQALVAAGGTAWSTLLRRHDRATGKWTAQPLPRGVDPKRAFISDLQGQALLVQGEQVFVWNGKRFGPPISLGAGAAFQIALGGLLATDSGWLRVLDLTGKERLRAPAPPKSLAYRDLSPDLMVTWGVTEVRQGNNCNNPFHPQVRAPDQPVCTPSVGRTYTRIHPGGSFLLRTP